MVGKEFIFSLRLLVYKEVIFTKPAMFISSMDGLQFTPSYVGDTVKSLLAKGRIYGFRRYVATSSLEGRISSFNCNEDADTLC